MTGCRGEETPCEGGKSLQMSPRCLPLASKEERLLMQTRGLRGHGGMTGLGGKENYISVAVLGLPGLEPPRRESQRMLRTQSWPTARWDLFAGEFLSSLWNPTSIFLYLNSK